MAPLEQLGFYLAGYGCTTCIGNSGPLDDAIAAAVKDGNLVVASVLSGNRNFEGRVNPLVRANYLASPPLVVAYALAGTWTSTSRPSRSAPTRRRAGLPKDSGRRTAEVAEAVRTASSASSSSSSYAHVLDGDAEWRALQAPTGETFAWDDESTYMRKPALLRGPRPDAEAARPTSRARACSRCSATR